MTGHAGWLIAAALLGAFVSSGCNASPEEQAAEAAQNASEVAVTSEQAQLWQDAAGRGAPGLERVPVVQEPIQRRETIQQPSPPSRPVPQQPITIPREVLSEIRILTYPKVSQADYSGPATVIDTAGDQIRLDLGAAGTMTLLARAGGKPLPFAAKETVQVVYQVRKDSRFPDDVIAIRGASGAGIAHVVRDSDQPVELTVPLFGITARQKDEPGLPVQFNGGGFKGDDLTMGQIRSSNEAAVLVVGSLQYTLNVLVWRNP